MSIMLLRQLVLLRRFALHCLTAQVRFTLSYCAGSLYTVGPDGRSDNLLTHRAFYNAKVCSC